MEVNGDPDLAARVRVLRIITVALGLGPLAFLAVAAALHSVGPDRPGNPDVSAILLAVGCVMFAGAMGFLVVGWPMLVNAGRRQLAGEPRSADTDANLLVLFQTTHIFRLAVVEGSTFVLLIEFFLNRDAIAAGVAVLGIGVMFAHTPTTAGIDAWLERQRELIAEDRAAVPGGENPIG